MRNNLFIVTRPFTYLILAIAVLGTGSTVQAGENLDSLIVEARQAAMDTSNRDAATEMCHHALSKIPDTMIGHFRPDDLQLVNTVKADKKYLFVAGGLGGLKILEVTEDDD